MSNLSRHLFSLELMLAVVAVPTVLGGWEGGRVEVVGVVGG